MSSASTINDSVAAVVGEMMENITEKNMSETDPAAAEESQEFEIAFAFWLLGCCGTVIGLMGIFGNLMSIKVLSHKQMRSSPNFILIALAASDLILIITSIIIFCLTTIYPYSNFWRDYYFVYFPILSTVAFPLASIAQTISIYMTFLISFERYIAVCHPFKARSFCTQTRTKILIFVTVTLSIIYNLPKFFEIKLTTAEDGDFGTVYRLKASDLRINPDYIEVYIHWAYFILMVFIPLSCITFFNVMIYRQVRVVNRMRIKLTSKEMQDIKLTTMLFCVVIVFMSCNFLAVLTNILEVFYGIYHVRLTNSSNFLVTFNSSVNFIIYVVLVKKFRRIFIRQIKSMFNIKDSNNSKFLDRSSSMYNQYTSVRRRTETETLTTIEEWNEKNDKN